MPVWRFASTALLLFNAGDCVVKIVADIRNPNLANGVWGLVALSGAVSALTSGVFAASVARSGI